MRATENSSPVAKTLRSSQEILLLTHQSPDGDALGGMLGLGLPLIEAGKKVAMVIEGPLPAHMAWLPGSSLFETKIPERNFDAVVMLDCGDKKRTGFDLSPFEKIPLVNIDHHASNDNFGTVNYVHPEASSTGELVLRILDELGITPDADAATALYVAVLTDTGGFHYSNSTPEAFETSARLVRLGANPAQIAGNLYERESAKRTLLMGLVLSTLSLYSGGKVARIHVTGEMLAKTGASLEDTDNFVNCPRAIEGVEVAVFMKEKPGNVWRITLRSKGGADVSKVASAFGGGGHKKASGATIDGDFEGAFGKLLGEIEKVLAGPEPL
ncbi:bifunctional oligoribonuclease/PAP phosphatase NrnA [bacterium]|nr:MAG: bifunctional oligoribonuclease/PAP phosphatase NrnA [bacterium]